MERVSTPCASGGEMSSDAGKSEQRHQARQKPTKGSNKAFVAAFKQMRRLKKDRRPGQLTPAPMERAFEELYRAAHARLGIPERTGMDVYGLGKRLAAEATTLDELDVAWI